MSSFSATVDPAIFGAPLCAGGVCVSVARCADEIKQAQALRGLAFGLSGPDADDHDAGALHLLARDPSQAVLGTLRLMAHQGSGLTRGYTGGLYDLRGLAALPGCSLEMGRLCLHPHSRDPDLVRLMLAGVTRVADLTGAARLLGCVSFSGTDVQRIAPALALLRARHLGPPALCAAPRAPHWIDLPQAALDPQGLALLPTALRFYLSLGAWVSDRAVIDTDLGTIHVLCVLEIDAMPQARRERLRAMARGA
jgi:putative hemolysin